MKRIAMFVEGHGEVEAAAKLVSRIAHALELDILVTKTLRRPNIHRADGITTSVRYGETLGVDGLLLLRDEDDACPKETAPRAAEMVRANAPKLPVAVVLMHREYEVVFLPCIRSLAGKPIDGRPGLLPGTQWIGPWESRRDVKGWLTEHMPPRRSYKPTLDQLPLTQMLDVKELLSADVPCVGSLVRALRFLATTKAGVYPGA